jgi:hypothetical protein
LEKDMTEHVAKAQAAKEAVSEMVRDAYDRRDARHDKNFQEIYKQKDASWVAKERKRSEAYARIEKIRATQSTHLPSGAEALPDGGRGNSCSQATRAGRATSGRQLTDHASVHARLLLASVCDFVLQHQGSGALLSLPQGFEAMRRK